MQEEKAMQEGRAMPGINPFVVTGDIFSLGTSLATTPGSPRGTGMGTGIPPGAILASLLFSFPVLLDQNPSVNDGQTVTVVVLDSAGEPVVDSGGPEVPTALGVTGYGYGLYGCRVAVPPGFKGSVLATMTTGPNAGQTSVQPIDFSRAVDISPLSITAGGPAINPLDPAQLAVEGSDGWVFVRVTATSVSSALPSLPTDLTNNPVEIAIVGGVPDSGDFLPAEWLTLTSGPAKGVYARLYLSALDGTAPPAGAYRVFVRINGTTTFRAPSILIVQRDRGSGISAPSAVNALPISLPLSPSQFAVLSAQNAQIGAQNAALTKQLGDFIMAYVPGTPSVPNVTLAATSTLTLPLQDTRYLYTGLTANVATTLPKTTGSGRKLFMDFETLGAFSVALTLASGDAYNTPLPAINTGVTFTLVDAQAGMWVVGE